MSVWVWGRRDQETEGHVQRRDSGKPSLQALPPFRPRPTLAPHLLPQCVSIVLFS